MRHSCVALTLKTQVRLSTSHGPCVQPSKTTDTSTFLLLSDTIKILNCIKSGVDNFYLLHNLRNSQTNPSYSSICRKDSKIHQVGGAFLSHSLHLESLHIPVETN